MIDTTWWEKQHAATFLSFNWSHPSRKLATDWALVAAFQQRGELIEVGPGAGVDYLHAFRPHVLAGDLTYTGYEATAAFHAALESQYPEATWEHASCYELPRYCADVVYARAVLEHQPTLSPALGHILDAAHHAVVLDFYRPPAARAFCDFVGGVPCHTFAESDVLDGIARAGFHVTQRQRIDGNEVWMVER